MAIKGARQLFDAGYRSSTEENDMRPLRSVPGMYINSYVKRIGNGSDDTSYFITVRLFNTNVDGKQDQLPLNECSAQFTTDDDLIFNVSARGDKFDDVEAMEQFFQDTYERLNGMAYATERGHAHNRADGLI